MGNGIPDSTDPNAAVRMPTAADYKGPKDTGHQVNIPERIRGTDQWNALIVQVCKENGGVNPVFVKCIMATESGGTPGGKPGGSGGRYVGLMQVDYYNWNQDPRLMGTSTEDAKFQIDCGVKELISKYKDPWGRWKDKQPDETYFRYHDKNDTETIKSDIFNVAWFYVGYAGSTYSKTYPLQIRTIYNGLGYSLADQNYSVFYYDPTTKTPGSGTSTGGSGSGGSGGGSSTTTDEWQGGQSYQIDPANYDGDVFQGITGMVDRRIGLPPNYYDDDYSELPYRSMGSDYFVRIGDSRFIIPPSHIRVSEESETRTWNVLRQRQSMKSQSGNSTRYIDMTLYFVDNQQINGYGMNGPDNQRYYMDGLRSLIAQMKVMPFLPIENEFLNYSYNIFAVALVGINVETVPGFPNMLRANLSMIEYDTTPFLNKPSWMYDQHFMWPLFRWFYQRNLVGPTNDDRQFDKNNMAWYSTDSKFLFWYIEEEALQGQQDAIVKKNQDALEKGEREPSWFDFRGNNIKSGQSDNALFSPFIFPNTLIPVSISASTGNQLAPLTPSFLGKPTFQYFGSQDTRINVVFQTTNRADIQALVSLKDRVDRYNREYREQFVGGYLRVENNFINMLGVGSVMIESLVVQTVEGSPGLFNVAMNLVSYEETQVQNEKLHIISGIDPKLDSVANMQGFDYATTINFVKQPVRVERMMDGLELYPDLRLPSYNTVNDILQKINDWRSRHNLKVMPLNEIAGIPSAAFADPDFYFIYPELDDLVTAIENAQNDPKIKQYAAQYDETLDDNEKLDLGTWKDIFGPDIKDDLKEHDVDGKFQLDKMYDDYKMQDLSLLKAEIDDMNRFVSSPSSYVKYFWVKAWQPEGGSYKTVDYSKIQVRNGEPKVVYYHKEKAVESTQILMGDTQFKVMMHDMIKYDKRGTMLRAFPTFVFMIIDEGKWVNINKLWDLHYTYHSVSEINVHMDRRNPIHTAYIKLSNVYGALNRTTKYGYDIPKDQYGFTDILTAVERQLWHDVSQKQLDERDRVYEEAKIMAGARIHIRMGYGAAASQLPPVFNGVVADIDLGDVVTIVAQSHGYQLTNPIMADPGETNSMFKEGKEPTDMFRYYMVERKSNWAFYVREQSDPGNYQSAYGIDDFGFLMRMKKSAGFFSGGLNNDTTLGEWMPAWMTSLFNQIFSTATDQELGAEDYDVMKNIYSTLGQFKYGEADTATEPPEDTALKAILNDTNSLVRKYRPKSRDVSKFGINSDSWWKSWTDELKNLFGFTTTPDVVKNVNTIDDIKLVLAVRDCYKPSDREGIITAVYACLANSQDEFLKKKFIKNDGKDGVDTNSIDTVVQDIAKVIPSTSPDRNEVIDTIRKMITEWATYYAKSYANWKALDDAKKEAQDKTGFQEQNTKMVLENKAPWDVFRTIERVTPEYIVYPHIHQFHYTLFFGKPWWDVQYGYYLPPIKNPQDGYGDKLGDYVELKKPFCQFHVFTSLSDILVNNVRAIGTNLITAATPVYKIGDDNSTYEVVWADYKMRSSFQRNRVIDTTLVQNAPFVPSWMERLAIWTQNIFDVSSDYQKQAVMYAQNVIAESFREMYDGEMTVIGDPTVKPYDGMYLEDRYAKMNGNCEVGRVTHMMSLENGFVTSIKPDLTVAINPDPFSWSSEWDTNPDRVAGKLVVWSSGSIKIGGYATLALGTYRRLRDMDKYNVARKSLALLKSIRTPERMEFLLTGGRTAMKGMTTLASIIRGTRVAELVLDGLAPETGGVTLFLSFLLFVGSELLFAVLKKIFVQKFNNSIKILPLFHNGVPYVAGINGHQQLIPGWVDDGNGRPYRSPDGYDLGDDFNPQLASAMQQDARRHTDPNAPGGQNNGDGPVATLPGNAAPPITGVPPSDLPKRMSPNAPLPYYSWPLSGHTVAEVQSRVTPHGAYGYDRGDEIHKGIDLHIGPNGNRDVCAVARGKVVYNGSSHGFGHFVMILHQVPMADGSQYVFYSGYGHMWPQDVYVKVGDEVDCNSPIGKMGDNGSESSGMHLHVEIAMPNTEKDAMVTGTSEAFYNHYFMGRGGSNSRNMKQTYVNYISTLDFIAGIYNADDKFVKLIPPNS